MEWQAGGGGVRLDRRPEPRIDFTVPRHCLTGGFDISCRLPSHSVLPLLAFLARDQTRYLRYPVRLITKPSRVTIHGAHLPIPDGFPPDRTRSLYRERHERTTVRAVLGGLSRDDVVMEFGAGLGLLSTLCAQRIGSDRVVTYEANPAQIPYIEEVYRLNGVCPTLVHGAIGTTNDQNVFWVHDNIVSSSLLSSEGGGDAVTVPQLDINDQIDRYKPTFVIMDVEGMEGELLAAARLDPLEKVLVELHHARLGEDGIAALMQRMNDCGFLVNRWLSSRRKIFFER